MVWIRTLDRTLACPSAGDRAPPAHGCEWAALITLFIREMPPADLWRISIHLMGMRMRQRCPDSALQLPQGAWANCCMYSYRKKSDWAGDLGIHAAAAAEPQPCRLMFSGCTRQFLECASTLQPDPFQLLFYHASTEDAHACRPILLILHPVTAVTEILGNPHVDNGGAIRSSPSSFRQRDS